MVLMFNASLFCRTPADASTEDPTVHATGNGVAVEVGSLHMLRVVRCVSTTLLI